MKCFFPSEFKEGNEIAKDAIVISSALIDDLPDKHKDFLKSVGVQEMSRFTIIDTVLCKEGYITKTNAFEVLRYIFEYNQTDNIFEKISTWRLKNIKVLTTNGTLKIASELYLSDVYNPVCKIQSYYPQDIFVSELYIGTRDEKTEWNLFFKKLGVKEDIKLELINYDYDSWVRKNSIISSLVSLAKNTEYNPWGSRKYYLGCGGDVFVTVNSSPLLNPNLDISVDFYSAFWQRIFSQEYAKGTETIYGSTGYGWSKTVSLSSSKYLGESFIDWLIKTFPVLPGSDKQLHKVTEILVNSKSNLEIFGCYFPVLAITEKINTEWENHLKFKNELTLSEFLEVLSKISKDTTKEQITDNKERICKIYDLIANNFDFSEGSSNYNLIRNWGKTNKILSKELEFLAPEKLCLLSNKITGVDINNQVFHHKAQENDRFADMMIAMGVNFIRDHRVEGIENSFPNNEIKEIFESKIEFFTAITSSDTFTVESWNEALRKIRESLNNLSFFNVDEVKVVYGNQSISKPVYVKDSNIYYVGKFNLAIKEMLTPDLVRIFGLHRYDQTIFLTLLQMKDFDEIIEYLDLKEYDTQFIKRPNLLDINPKAATLGGEDSSLTGLTREHMQAALAEAKDTIISQLSLSGFDVTNYSWDGWTLIDGITKEGIEYPLVIRSNKSGSNTRLSSLDWNQLMKPNAMFVVNTNSGVGTINFKELLRSKDNITIRFSSGNIDNPDHITNLAEVFTYFKGLQFDFESFIQPVIRRWESFLAPEVNTGEKPEAGNIGILPE